ncbi:MAG TPA: small basic protein [Candidatus Omnitrophota bacterium]|nr:small basic protein [Candidatus Omnitrophota bacterium]
MSQHTSLKLKALSGRHRNVLKRYERIKKLKQDERWQDGMSAYGLPKVKSVKVKVKKAKAGPKAEGAEGATPAAGGTAAAPAK